MARPTTRKPKGKKGGAPEDQLQEATNGAATTTAVAEAPAEAELQPPTKPVEATDGPEEVKPERRGGEQRDRIAASLNIAKLPAMSMTP